MAELLARQPFEGLLPHEEGGVRLSAADPGAVCFVQPFRGQADAVGAALKEAVGAGWPGPGEALGGHAARVLWCGPGQALVLGAAVELAGAAVIDQTDAYAVGRLEGAGARAVLARLTPLDLSPSRFGLGRTARTLLGHMVTQLTPVGAEAFEVMVARSMAGSLVHDLDRAMGFVAGRARLG